MPPEPKSFGKVSLVGAGPGDPDLLTVKGRCLLQSCDVVAYDYLVDARLLKLTKPDCRHLCVGKRQGFHSLPQDEIEALLVREAQAGHHVVRLKGGDPFIFGRGGEEVSRLHAAGIPFEVVPGITAASAASAYLGVPLSHRSHGAVIVYATGHEDPAKGKPTVDWRALAKLEGTLCLYMAMGHLPEIVEELMAGGLSPETPAVVAQWVTTEKQKAICAQLTDLPMKVAETGMASPAMVLVGNVAKDYPKLAWSERNPI